MVEDAVINYRPTWARPVRPSRAGVGVEEPIDRDRAAERVQRGGDAVEFFGRERDRESCIPDSKHCLGRSTRQEVGQASWSPR